MRVKAGEIVKNVPQEYACGVSLIKTSLFDKPDKIRLSKWERFLFAEAAWRSKQDKYISEYLNDRCPAQGHTQMNRSGKTRYLIRYEPNGTGFVASAVVPRSVFVKCPIDKVSHELIDWRE